MIRTVTARRMLTGTIDTFVPVFTRDTRALLQQAVGDEITPPDGDGSFALTLSTPGIAGHDAHKRVRVTLEEARTQGAWVSVPLRWRADPAPALFPTFEGSLELEQLDAVRLQLSVFGTYRPPMGPLGAVADTMGTHALAQRAVSRLVNAVAAMLTAHVHDASVTVSGDNGQHHGLLVGDVMSAHLLTIEESVGLRTAANRLLLVGGSGAPVVDRRGRVVGVLSERDLLDKVAPAPLGLGREAGRAWRHHESLTAGEICTRPARVTSSDATVRAAAAEMAEHDVDRLVVMEGAMIIGILTRHDVLKVLVRPDEDIAEHLATAVHTAGEDSISIDVRDGHVDLTGELTVRSQVYRVLAAAEEVDGVIDVDAKLLTWARDDVAVPPLL